ncbi:MAG: cobyric acid synthase [Cenarchaeum sp. SB0664_bin_35]|nr:cobyric acid synthase [Cenarchaeum sp. SB0664_bin_35]
MPCIMIQGTMSGAGKSTLVTALCRILSDMKYDVVPFKSQNMSSFTHDKLKISRAQATQAQAARCEVTPEINPILLVPYNETSSEVFEMGRSRGTMDTWTYYKYAENEGIRAAATALSNLRQNHDVVILEGAGSPAEINIPFDMANMMMAKMADASVIITADIERGGCFAQMVGTISLLPREHSQRVEGFVINKFRGDASILYTGIQHVRRVTNIDTIGVIPYTDVQLPPEDSLDYHNTTIPTEQAIASISDIIKENINVQHILDCISS